MIYSGHEYKLSTKTKNKTKQKKKMEFLGVRELERTHESLIRNDTKSNFISDETFMTYFLWLTIVFMPEDNLSGRVVSPSDSVIQRSQVWVPH